MPESLALSWSALATPCAVSLRWAVSWAMRAASSWARVLRQARKRSRAALEAAVSGLGR